MKTKNFSQREIDILQQALRLLCKNAKNTGNLIAETCEETAIDLCEVFQHGVAEIIALRQKVDVLEPYSDPGVSDQIES